MSNYRTVNYFTHWRFPSVTERMAEVTTRSDIGKVAWQESDDSLWMRLANGWLRVNSTVSTSSADNYVPLQSYDVEIIPIGKQRLVYGDFEIIGDIELIGDLVIL